MPRREKTGLRKTEWVRTGNPACRGEMTDLLCYKAGDCQWLGAAEYAYGYRTNR